MKFNHFFIYCIISLVQSKRVLSTTICSKNVDTLSILSELYSIGSIFYLI